MTTPVRNETMSTEPIKSFTERAKIALEDRERYTVDNGRRCVCEKCGAEHYRRVETKSDGEREK